MNKPLITTLLLLVASLCVSGASYYMTDVRQEAQIEHLHEARRVAELQNARVDELLIELASSEEQAAGTLAQWRSRYKYIPATLNTADMVEYLEGLTRSGFEQFDTYLTGQHDGSDFSTTTFRVEGTAFYQSLYHLLWHLENNRAFYRIHDLQVEHVNVFKKNRATDLDRRFDMVAFSFDLQAYYAGPEGISAPGDSLRPIPRSILQDHEPADASFTPLIRTDLPPNDELLLDIERADLLAIIGQKAIFEDRNGRHVVFEGDRIYLGEIDLIDPINSLVRATLNKGDKVETISVRLDETADGDAEDGTSSLDAYRARVLAQARAARAASSAQAASNPAPAPSTSSALQAGDFIVVTASLSNQAQADEQAEALGRQLGEAADAFVLSAPEIGRFRVALGPYASSDAAHAAIDQLGSSVPADAWVMAY